MSLTGDLSVDKDYIIHTHMRDYFRSNERCQLRRGRRIIKLAFFLFFFFVEISARRDANRISHVPVNLSDSYQISDYEIVFVPGSILASAFDLCAYQKMTKRISLSLSLSLLI